MGTILDILLCVLVLCFVISGFKIGLVRSLVELIGYIFAIIAAVTLSDRLAVIVGAYLTKLTPLTALNHIIIKTISMVIIFVVLQLLVQIVSRALDTVFKLPVLHQVNSLLGGVFGLLKGALVVFLICAVLQLALPVITAKYPNSDQDIGRSNIYKYLYVHNPVYLLYQTEI